MKIYSVSGLELQTVGKYSGQLNRIRMWNRNSDVVETSKIAISALFGLSAGKPGHDSGNEMLGFAYYKVNEAAKQSTTQHKHYKSYEFWGTASLSWRYQGNRKLDDRWERQTCVVASQSAQSRHTSL